jgi:hypothetical protein
VGSIAILVSRFFSGSRTENVAFGDDAGQKAIFGVCNANIYSDKFLFPSCISGC